jgi:SAM-dependent methyltransferase
MPPDVTWRDLERVVADAALQPYQELRSDAEREDFLRALYVGNKEFDALNRATEPEAAPDNVRYWQRNVGVAYALWYHMLRTENIYLALEAACRERALPRAVRMLDVGSGTGAGAMAMAYLLRAEGRPLNASVSCVERYDEMRAMADRILGGTRAALGIGEERFRWNHAVRDLLEASELPESDTFEVVLFSHTFWVQAPDVAERTRARTFAIARHLAPNGLLCFLTPRKPPQKTKFIDSICEQLAERGFQRLEVEPGEEDFPSDRCRPHPIMNARNFYNQERRRLGLPSFFRGVSYYFRGVPYYSFDCQCDVFTR